MRKLLIALILSLVSGISSAENVKPIFNALTGKFDFVTAMTTNTIVPGAGISVSCTNGVCTLTAAGSAASNLETLVNDVRITSPTATIHAKGTSNGIGIQAAATGSTATLTFSMLPGNTNYIQVSNTLQSGSTFYVSSGTFANGLYVNGNASNTGNLYLQNGASLAYGTLTPGHIIDLQGVTASGTPLASITHADGIALQVGGSSNQIAFDAYNNSHGENANAGRFGKLGGSAPALYAQTTSTGSAAAFYANSGVAIDVLGGSSRLGSSTVTIRGVDMIWPSSGTIGGFLQYASTNTLAWGTPSGSGSGGGGAPLAGATYYIQNPATGTWVNTGHGIVASTVTATSIGNTQIVYGGANGLLTGSSGFQFNGTSATIVGNAGISGMLFTPVVGNYSTSSSSVTLQAINNFGTTQDVLSAVASTFGGGRVKWMNNSGSSLSIEDPQSNDDNILQSGSVAPDTVDGAVASGWKISNLDGLTSTGLSILDAGGDDDYMFLGFDYNATAGKHDGAIVFSSVAVYGFNRPIQIWNFDSSRGGYLLNISTGGGSYYPTGQAIVSVSSTGVTAFNGNIDISSGLVLSGTTGNNGQVLTSGGAGTVPTWTTISGGGGSSTLETIVGTRISSPTATLSLNSSQFTGVLAGLATAQIAINTSSITALGSSIDLSGAEASGILAAGRFPALTGDMTTSAGALATTLAATIPNAHTWTGSNTVTAAGGFRSTYNVSAGSATFGNSPTSAGYTALRVVDTSTGTNQQAVYFGPDRTTFPAGLQTLMDDSVYWMASNNKFAHVPTLRVANFNDGSNANQVGVSAISYSSRTAGGFQIYSIGAEGESFIEGPGGSFYSIGIGGRSHAVLGSTVILSAGMYSFAPEVATGAKIDTAIGIFVEPITQGTTSNISLYTDKGWVVHLDDVIVATTSLTIPGMQDSHHLVLGGNAYDTQPRYKDFGIKHDITSTSGNGSMVFQHRTSTSNAADITSTGPWDTKMSLDYRGRVVISTGNISVADTSQFRVVSSTETTYMAYFSTTSVGGNTVWISTPGQLNVSVGMPHSVSYKAAVCQNTTASLGFSTYASSGPTAACFKGANTTIGIASFVDTSTNTVQDHFRLPSSWVGNISANIVWKSTDTTGDVRWKIQTSCVADGETGDPSWNTASGVTDATKGTTNQYNTAEISALPVTGCSAGEEFFFELMRDPTDPLDTLAATADLIGLEITVRRSE